jgi:1-aminocyclopropane-1-carboxylate deaminase/D-cysteine desulfhydrase-like pyridoxal-dependent ACC family enzyme
VEPPRLPILYGPTPLHPLLELSRALGGPAFWIKRDDLTPLAFGGNKLRKLELHLAAAAASGADTVITSGAAQSNHACQTAAAGRRFGFEVVLLLRGAVDAPVAGNLLLDHLFGAEVRLEPEPPADWSERVAAELIARGRVPFTIPYGGTNALGAFGYLWAARELRAEQRRAFAEVLVTSSSGGTQAGLALAEAQGTLGPVLGVSVDLDRVALGERVHDITSDAAARYGLTPVARDRVRVDDRFRAGGYGRIDPATQDAIRLLARCEGIVADPVYTGKMFAAAIALAQEGRWSKRDQVLLWHTGGRPALFVPGSADWIAASRSGATSDR